MYLKIREILVFSISIFIFKNLYRRFFEEFGNNFTLPKVSLKRLQEEIENENLKRQRMGVSKQMQKNYMGEWN